jgi:hypothetical protein
MELNFELKHRIDTAFFEIIRCDPVQRQDLQKMWRQARGRWNELDIELITCRRQNKRTPRYQEIEKDLLERMDTIEKYLIFALLTK